MMERLNFWPSTQTQTPRSNAYHLQDRMKSQLCPLLETWGSYSSPSAPTSHQLLKLPFSSSVRSHAYFSSLPYLLLRIWSICWYFHIWTTNSALAGLPDIGIMKQQAMQNVTAHMPMHVEKFQHTLHSEKATLAPCLTTDYLQDYGPSLQGPPWSGPILYHVIASSTHSKPLTMITKQTQNLGVPGLSLVFVSNLSVTSASTISAFKSSLKTLLFTIAYYICFVLALNVNCLSFTLTMSISLCECSVHFMSVDVECPWGLTEGSAL